jgi:hypothetical protein
LRIHGGPHTPTREGTCPSILPKRSATQQQMMAFSVAFWRLDQQVVVKRIFGLVPTADLISDSAGFAVPR